jgi:hypothetical protein
LVKLCRLSRSVDSSEADWAATLWLIIEPATAQVAKKTVTEKRARRVRGAIDWVTSKKSRAALYLAPNGLINTIDAS